MGANRGDEHSTTLGYCIPTEGKVDLNIFLAKKTCAINGIYLERQSRTYGNIKSTNDNENLVNYFDSTRNLIRSNE